MLEKLKDRRVQIALLVVVGVGGVVVYRQLAGVKEVLDAAAPAVEVLSDAKYGSLYGICCVCGRTLTDESSIAAGIGPICSQKF